MIFYITLILFFNLFYAAVKRARKGMVSNAFGFIFSAMVLPFGVFCFKIDGMKKMSIVLIALGLILIGGLLYQEKKKKALDDVSIEVVLGFLILLSASLAWSTGLFILMVLVPILSILILLILSQRKKQQNKKTA